MVYPVRQKRDMVELSQPYHMMISGCAKEDQEIGCNPLWRVKISPFLNWKRNNNMQYYYVRKLPILHTGFPKKDARFSKIEIIPDLNI